jgi:integrase
MAKAKRLPGVRQKTKGGTCYIRIGNSWLSAHTTDVAAAYQERCRRLGHGFKATTETTFEAFVPRYLEHAALDKRDRTVQGEGYMLAGLTSRWGAVMVSRLTLPMVEDWVRSMKAAGLTGATINRHLSCLSKLLKYAVACGHLDTVPALPRQAESPAHRPGLSRDEVRDFLAAADAKGRQDIILYLYLCAYTGMRRGSIDRLTWADIHDGAIWLRADQTKNGKALTIDLNAEVAGLVESMRGEGRILPYSMNVYDKHIRGMLKTAGLYEQGRGVHALRRFFATEMLRVSDIETVRQLLDHADIQTTARYLDTDRERKREAINRLSLKDGQVIRLKVKGEI